MISKLVIGKAREGEVQSPEAMHPSPLRAWLDALWDDDTEHVVCTFSPVIVGHVVYRDRQEMDDQRAGFDLVFLRSESTGMDTPLLDEKDAAWLCHFDVGHLYAGGHLDALLN